MSESEPLQLSASTAKSGETLQGDLVLGEATPGLNQVRRVVMHVRGKLEYPHKGGTRSKDLSGGPEFVWESPPRGELRVPFKLSLPPDALPIFRGELVQITWEIVASLQGEDGKELLSLRQPLQLHPPLTAHPPTWVDRPAPVAASPPGCLGKWGDLFLPAIFCFGLPISALVEMFDRSTQNSMIERVAWIILSLVLLAGGGLITLLIVGRARLSSMVTVASLVSLAERFPRGATARLRVFLQLTKALTVREAKLKLGAYEESRPIRSTEVTVQLPRQLAEGRHQFDLEIPIPRDFPPTFEKHLATSCTLTLSFEGLDDLWLHEWLVLTPEVLEEGAGATGAS